MKQAIAGSHQSPEAQKVLSGDAQATANLLQQFGKNQAQSVPAGLSFDSLIAALGQASGQAQLAAGQAEKNIAYGQAASTAPLYGATGASPASSALGPLQAGALLNQTLGATQTSPARNPLYPNLP
jgi:hypothetical protein